MSKEAMKLALEKIADALPAYIDGVASREYLATIHKALAEQPAPLFSDRVVDMAKSALAEQPAQQEAAQQRIEEQK